LGGGAGNVSSGRDMVLRTPAAPASDTTAPSVSLVTPAAGAHYPEGSTVLANYVCADEDGGSGIRFCGGTVSEGSPLDTSAGSGEERFFVVTAYDRAEHSTSAQASYYVDPPPPPPPAPIAAASVSGLPTVITGCALGISLSGASLTGAVNPQGSTTTYWFTFKAGTHGLPQETPHVKLPTTLPGDYTVGAFTGNPNFVNGSDFSLAISYTLHASNASGETSGTTEAAAPPLQAPYSTTQCGAAGREGTATTQPAEPGRSQATLHGVVNGAGLPTAYEFLYFAREFGVDVSEVATPQHLVFDGADHPVSSHIERLPPGQDYRYKVVTFSRAGRVDGDSSYFRTPGCQRESVSSSCTFTAAVANVTVEDSTVQALVTIDPALVRVSAAAKARRKRLSVGRLTLRHVHAGHLTLTVPVNKRTQRKFGSKRSSRRLRGIVTITVTPPSGHGKPVVTTQKASVRIARRR
jgi:hypothetical protein